MYKNYQMRKVKVVAARKKAKILSSFVPSNSNDRSRLITDVGRAKPLMNVNGTIEETMAVQLTERPESLIFGTETELNVEHIASQKSIDDQKLGVTEASVVDFAALQQRAHDYEPKDDLIVHSTSPNTELSPTLATEIGPNIKRPEFIAVQIEEIEGDKKNEYQKQRECEDKMQKESDIVLERHQNDKKDEDLAAPVPIEHRPLTETQLELIPPMDYFPSDQNVKTRERDYDGWNFVRQNLNLIIQLGVTEGSLPPREKDGSKPKKLVSNMKATMIAEGYDLEHKEKTKELNEVHIPVNEVSLLYEAIPFLPIVPAVFCCVLNFILPGSGSLLCGFFLLCVGQPRIQMKEGRVFMSILVNVFVGVAQFGTITFLLVGYFWSVAWGLLLLTHSLRYREALKERKQTQVATEALELLTKDTLLRRKEVKELVRAKRTGKVFAGVKPPLPPTRQISNQPTQQQQRLGYSVPNVPPNGEAWKS